MKRGILFTAYTFYPLEIFNIIKFSVDRGSHDDKLVVTLFFFINFFLINFIIISIISLIILMVKSFRERKIREMSEKYQNMLAEYIFYEGTEEGRMAAFEEINGDKFKRAILIDQILRLNKNIFGEAKGKLRDLFLALKLNEDALKNINSPKWHIKAKGMRQLAEMDFDDANSKIEQNLNSANDILSFEAQLAMVQLNKTQPFSFLDKLKGYFPLWNQLNIHMLVHLNNIKVPEFSKWLKSDNHFVSIFALRMIYMFQQQKALGDVILLLNHENEIVRRNAIITLGKLGLTEALLNLQNIYLDETYENRLQILKAMQNLPDESSIKFLGEALKENDNIIRLEAAKALLVLGELGRSKLQFTAMSSDIDNADIVSIINHALDKRII